MNFGQASALTGNALTTVNALIIAQGMKVLAGILILIAGWTIATWAKRLVGRGLTHIPLDLTLKPLIASLARYTVLVVTVVLVLGQLGFQTTSLIAMIGAAGIAIGLALQGTLSNVAAGVMLLVLRPFRVGHFVQAGGVSGTIREIGLFTTLMTTRDLVYISLPNSAVWSGVITNYTREPLRRISFTLPIDIANDVDKAEKVILGALANDTKILKAPEPWVGVSEIQEYSVVMTVNCYAKSEDYWRTLPAMQKTVKAALDKAGIMFAVTRQAVAVRNERETAINRAMQAPSETRRAAAE
jgi:small conductance mechanosensitive channel